MHNGDYEGRAKSEKLVMEALRIMLSERDLCSAIPYLEESASLDPTTYCIAKILKALVFLKVRRKRGAIKLLKEIFESDHELRMDPFINGVVASALVEAKMFQEALEYLERVRAWYALKGEYLPKLELMVATCYEGEYLKIRDKKYLEKAMDYVARANNPNYIQSEIKRIDKCFTLPLDSRLRLAQYLYKKGELRDAVNQLMLQTKYDPFDYKSWLYLMLIHLEMVQSAKQAHNII